MLCLKKEPITSGNCFVAVFKTLGLVTSNSSCAYSGIKPIIHDISKISKQGDANSVYLVHFSLYRRYRLPSLISASFYDVRCLDYFQNHLGTLSVFQAVALLKDRL